MSGVLRAKGRRLVFTEGKLVERPTLFFGLSYNALDRLREDEPIHVFAEEFNSGVAYDVVIFAGPTSEWCAEHIAGPDYQKILKKVTWS